MLSLSKYVLLISPLNSSFKILARTRFQGRNTRHRLNSGVKLNHNVGIRNQMRALELDENDLKNVQSLEDEEKSLWDVDMISDDYERERYRRRNAAGLNQVRRKYFKPDPLPNMLTWEEKEKIKALHSENPEHWTAMRLAHSFPATPPIIMKLLKGNEKMYSLSQIQKHDKRVYRNWQLFRDGKLEIPDKSLEQHLTTFTQSREPVREQSSEIVSVDPPILKERGVFSGIYDSYVKLKEKTGVSVKDGGDSITDGLSLLHRPVENDTFIIPQEAHKVEIRTRKPLTLEAMQEHVLNRKQISKKMGPIEEKFLSAYKEDNPRTFTPLKDPVLHTPKLVKDIAGQMDQVMPSLVQPSISPTNADSDEETMVDETDYHSANKPKKSHHALKFSQQEFLKSLQDPETCSVHTEKALAPEEAVSNYLSQYSKGYPLKIRIPEGSWKKGGIYRLKDCFYSDDGIFLYRVPGLQSPT